MAKSIAVAQVGADLGDVPANVARCQEVLQRAARLGAHAVVFPEAILSGYMLESRSAAARAAITRDGDELRALLESVRLHDVVAVVGFIEADGDGLYNAAALLQPTGRVDVYRKAHLPVLGVDRFLDRGDGDGPVVIDTPVGRIGLAICYDLRFPEPARCLALAGADILAWPSNWPPEARMLAEHFGRVRACENRVHVAIANRHDRERGVRFMGHSQIVAPSGEVLAIAGDEEEILVAEIEPEDARDKSIVVTPGEYEVHLFADRRPSLYGAITAPQQQAAGVPV